MALSLIRVSGRRRASPGPSAAKNLTPQFLARKSTRYLIGSSFVAYGTNDELSEQAAF
jgi:hypothetical protein